ncbi:MAG: GNAT family N-acetyltransferase [Patiriisocius sp.]|uniref:GNAT family N-acetyltransferase n=1 Tax=Patiriisocius sp. TaxID=2822396 RepID=UPI003EF307A8
MTANFAIIPSSEILKIIPFLSILNDHKISEAILKERVLEMSTQNYECIGISYDEKLIGICGMWFQTRHYAGKSVEVDHVVIEENFRGKKIGDQLMQFVYNYAKSKKCRWVELNTYVHNFPSHKFYYNQGFVAKGYHFVKEL